MGMNEWVVCTAKWLQFVIGFAMLFGSFMHLNDVLSGQDWCKVNPDDFDCVGDSLSWATAGNRVKDYNGMWRQTFTFAPSYFIDTWTPFFFGFLCIIQHIPSLQMKQLVASWARCLGLYLFACFWAIFGYAGNWGVFWGFITTLALCPILLYLAVVDQDVEQTQVDFTTYLAMVGLTNASEESDKNPNQPGGMEGNNTSANNNNYDNAPSYGNEPKMDCDIEPEQNNTYTAPPATGNPPVNAPPVPSREPPAFAPDVPVQVEPENNHYG